MGFWEDGKRPPENVTGFLSPGDLNRLFKAATTPAEGNKHDAGKPRLDLVDPGFVEGVAAVLGFGAAKYGERNWEKGFAHGRAYAAAQRHLLAYWRGEETDPETGLPHLAHAACNLMFLSAFKARGLGTDDRPAR